MAIGWGNGDTFANFERANEEVIGGGEGADDFSVGARAVTSKSSM